MRNGAGGGGCFPTGKHYPGIAHLLRIVAAGLADECQGDCSLADLPLVAIDTETTGRDPANDRVVEVGCVVWQRGDVVTRQHWLVNPGRSIPQEAFDVHGIGDDDVRDKPAFSEIAGELVELLSGSIPLAYNAEFDREFLKAELQRAGILHAAPPPALRKGVEWIDPLVWVRELQKEEKSKALGEVCARLGIVLERAHRAASDAEAAVRVLHALCGDVRVPRTYAAFIQEQRRLSRIHDDERKIWKRPTVAA
ncbi:MAG TPA: 3'-5' exonuclease [Polyangiaceae bacterium]